MTKRLVTKIINSFETVWTAPANVTSISILVKDNFDSLVGGCAQVSAALQRNGSAMAAGFNANGSLGDGTIVPKSSLVLVSGGNSFVKITNSGSATHFLGLRSDGTILAWGQNTSGQIGDNAIVNRSIPTLVTNSSGFVDVATGFSTSFGVKTDGTAWSWGNNGNFQLGNNNSSIAAVSTPIQVIGTGYVQISGGENHVLALRNDGTAWSWGQNNNGQLGDGTTTSKSSPVQVAGGHRFIQVTTGGGVTTTSYGLKSNGEIWSWGTNLTGQLGIGDSILSAVSTPVQVIGGHSFVKMIGLFNSVMALKANGEAWGWGSNNVGQLGDNTLVQKSSPVQVVGGHSFVSIGSADRGVIALKSNGTAWTWGNNAWGQLAQNSVGVNRSSPIQVVGTNLFIPGEVFINKTIIPVIPNTNYTINFFLTTIGSSIFRNYNSRNNISIILEYYV